MNLQTLSPDESELLWVGAFRWYLGRCSPQISDFCELLIEQWPFLTHMTKYRISVQLEGWFRADDERRALPEEVHQNVFPLGEKCDRLSWERVRKLAEKILEQSLVVRIQATGTHVDDPMSRGV